MLKGDFLLLKIEYKLPATSKMPKIGRLVIVQVDRRAIISVTNTCIQASMYKVTATTGPYFLPKKVLKSRHFCWAYMQTTLQK